MAAQLSSVQVHLGAFNSLRRLVPNDKDPSALKLSSTSNKLLLSSLLNRYTLRLRDDTAESEYRLFFLLSTMSMWRVYIALSCLCIFLLVAVDALTDDRTITAYVLTPLSLAFVHVSALLASYRLSTTRLKELLHVLSTAVAASIVLLSVAVHSILLQRTDPVNITLLNYYWYKAGFAFIIATFVPCTLLKIRFIATTATCLLSWVCFLALGLHQFWPIADDNSIAIQFVSVTVITLCIGCFTALFAYDMELSHRKQFLSSQHYIRTNAKLVDQLQYIDKGFQRIVDIDSPLEKAMTTLKALMADPTLKTDNVRQLALALRLLHSGNVLMPDLQSQLDPSQIDNEQESWLFTEVAQRKIQPMRNDRSSNHSNNRPNHNYSDQNIDISQSNRLVDISLLNLGLRPNIRNPSTVLHNNVRSIVVSMSTTNLKSETQSNLIDDRPSLIDTMDMDIKLSTQEFLILVELDKEDGKLIQSIILKPTFTSLSIGNQSMSNPSTVVNWSQLTQYWNTSVEWNWDIFDYSTACDNLPLVPLIHQLFYTNGLFTTFKIPIDRFLRCMIMIERGYHLDLPYHNSVHATDVLHSCAYFSKKESIRAILTDLELLALYFAAAIHDHDHGGFNNGFLVATQDSKAVFYNDKSVMENHHLTSAFSILNLEENDFLCELNHDDRKLFRELVIDMVLATDLQQHFTLLSAFRSKLAIQDGFAPITLKEDRSLLLKVIVKVSDVSNPAKAFPISIEWCHRVTGEFYKQGDAEKKLGLPISAFMDRTMPNLSGSQISFIDFICVPLFEALNLYIPCPQQLAHLASNREYWTRSKNNTLPSSTSTSSSLQQSSNEKKDED